MAGGLTLLLVSATMAVVEERGRGSLDILLATPIATRGIVLAKWWGAFPRAATLPWFSVAGFRDSSITLSFGLRAGLPEKR